MTDIPTDDELLEWARECDLPSFIERAFEVAQFDRREFYDFVPYGSTTAELYSGPTMDDVPDSVLLQVAQEWWEAEHLDWKESDGVRWLV